MLMNTLLKIDKKIKLYMVMLIQLSCISHWYLNSKRQKDTSNIKSQYLTQNNIYLLIYIPPTKRMYSSLHRNMWFYGDKML